MDTSSNICSGNYSAVCLRDTESLKNKKNQGETKMFVRIRGYPNYSVNECGVVINNRTGRELKPLLDVSRNGGGV